jgi:hypothetical protein
MFDTLIFALLILTVFLLHYPIVNWITNRSFIHDSLIGLCLSAIISGIFANIAAGLIRPFILGMCIAGGIGWINLIRKKELGSLKSAIIIIPLVTIILSPFVYNNLPIDSLTTTLGGEQVLQFNRHYSYFASLSTEMLSADYLDRLQVRNFQPFTWSPYHFFNSGAQAVLQGLIPHPGLFSYQCTVLILTLLCFFAFAEYFLNRFGYGLAPTIGIITWGLLSVSFFGNAIFWHFITSGAISVFALFFLLTSLIDKNFDRSLGYGLLLGVSVFRLLPLSILFSLVLALGSSRVVISAYIDAKHSRFSSLKWELLLGLFIIYNALTLLSPRLLTPIISQQLALSERLISFGYSLLLISALGIVIRFHKKILKQLFSILDLIPKKLMTLVVLATIFAVTTFAMFGDTVLFSGWMSAFTLYHWVALVLKVISNDLGLFKGFNFYDNFTFYLNHPNLAQLLTLLTVVCFLATLIATGLIKYKHYFGEEIRSNRILKFSYIFLFVSFLFKSNINFGLLIIWYICLSICLLFVVYKEDKERKEAVTLILSTQLLAILSYYLLPAALGAPALSLFTDLFLWVILGVLLFRSLEKTRVVPLGITLSLILIMWTNSPLEHRLMFSPKGPHSYPVSLTPLIGHSRSDFVDKNGKLRPIPDPNTRDAFQAITGSALPFSADQTLFMNFRFINNEAKINK